MIKAVVKLRKSERGFSLVEVILVTVLLAMLATILYRTLDGLMRGKALLESERNRDRVALQTLDRMKRELRAWDQQTLTLNPNDQRTTSNSEISRLLLGNSSFVGKSSKGGKFQQDELFFVSSNTGIGLGGTNPNYGNVQIHYYLKENKERDAPDGSMILIREETPAGVSSKEVLEARQITLPVSNRVAGLQFRYLTQDKWTESWVNTQSGPPDAVEIKLTVLLDDETTKSYKTAVSLLRERSQFQGFR